MPTITCRNGCGDRVGGGRDLRPGVGADRRRRPPRGASPRAHAARSSVGNLPRASPTTPLTDARTRWTRRSRWSPAACTPVPGLHCSAPSRTSHRTAGFAHWCSGPSAGRHAIRIVSRVRSPNSATSPVSATTCARARSASGTTTARGWPTRSPASPRWPRCRSCSHWRPAARTARRALRNCATWCMQGVRWAARDPRRTCATSAVVCRSRSSRRLAMTPGSWRRMALTVLVPSGPSRSRASSVSIRRHAGVRPRQP